MVVESILPHAECGPNDHRKDAPLFKSLSKIGKGTLKPKLFIFLIRPSIHIDFDFSVLYDAFKNEF